MSDTKLYSTFKVCDHNGDLGYMDYKAIYFFDGDGVLVGETFIMKEDISTAAPYPFIVHRGIDAKEVYEEWLKESEGTN